MTTAVRITRNSDRNTFMEVGTMEDNRREELNQAIWYVITTDKPKKEMKDTVRLLKKAGYEVYKCDTHQWGVRNHKANRCVSAEYRRWKSEWVVWNSHRREIAVKLGHDPKIDFVGLLEKPLNLEWERRPERVYDGLRSRALKRYEKLQQKKRYVRYDEDDIKRTQQKIEELQKQLIREVEGKVRSQAELDNYRKEIGLRVRR